MQIVVLANKILKEELLGDTSSFNEAITWIEDVHQLAGHQNVDAIIDLLFEPEHTTILKNLLPRLIIINSVEQTLKETHSSFVRINGWPGFLQSPVIEAASLNEENKSKAGNVFSFFQKRLEWLPDEIGFVTPRVISMIVQEAFIALNEGVSTREEIDTAMKLGTNYPYGPFEWAEKIGVEKIKRLSNKLSSTH